MEKGTEKISILNASLMCGPPDNGFTEAVKKVFTGGYWPLNPSHPSFNEELLKLTKTHSPDVVFIQTQTNGILKPDVAKELAKHSFLIQFSGDIRHATESFYVEIGKVAQLTLFTNMRDVRTCRKLGIRSEWLELGVDPERFRSWEGIEVDYDIVAHMNDYGNLFELSAYRRDVVNALREEFGARFGVWGNFPGSRGDLNNDQIAESKNYMRSKLALNISNFCVEKYSSDRLVRILSTGGPMCITHDFPAIEEMYWPGKHLVTFKDIPDLVFKAKYFLEHEEERKEIAAAGQKHVLENYTFQKMAENILNLYKKYTNEQ